MVLRTRCCVHDVLLDTVRAELDVELGEDTHAKGVNRHCNLR